MSEQVKSVVALRVGLEIKVYDKEGKLIDKREYPANLVLDNMTKFLQALIRGGVQGLKIAQPVVDSGGVAVEVNIWSYAPTTSVYYIATYLAETERMARIAVGTGTIDPTRADYALASEYANTEEISVTYITEADGRRTCANAASITLAVGTTIYEIGMFMRWIDKDKVKALFLIVRDVLPTPVDVPDGGTISVVYKFTWG